MITDNIDNAFRSDRLIYRAIENNEADKLFLRTVQDDPINIALADLALIKPRGMDTIQDLVDNLLKSALAVMICRPPDDTQFSPKETPVGFIVLGWGGIPSKMAHHRNASMGIMLQRAHQNQGYGREAINWALDWGFRFGGYHRISINAATYNERALHLYKDVGFVEEGRSRETHWHDRKWYDTVNLGMLEHEWAALRGLDS